MGVIFYGATHLCRCLLWLINKETKISGPDPGKRILQQSQDS